jgi:hypothetical protein
MFIHPCNNKATGKIQQDFFIENHWYSSFQQRQTSQPFTKNRALLAG